MLIHKEFTIDQIHDTLVEGIRKYFADCKVKRAILGLSGGIDSAVVGVLATEALGVDNMHAFMMPSEFSTLHSIQDAVDLAENLGIKYDVVAIGEIYKRYMRELEPVFGLHNKWNVAEENLQARIRANLLMAYSNKFNALVINTSNKSELCMGYGTLYGDLAGALMPIADLYKGDIYELAYYINSNNNEVIPQSTLTKAPSAELHPGQKDSDSLPEYEIMDPLLYAMNEGGKSAAQLIKDGADKAVIKRITELMSKSSFKVHQLPPILNISSKPIGYKEKWLL
ncbi:MAG: NAD(+) synthase [Bacteroidales bacterium]|jgi:NAD+ synthase (glutamine-hydrolysing)|nr:NAD(+) synthase [Bacteroidales bacterium]MCI1733826.1 NAD(+) synthase [Bacteroidales bacterium]